MFKILQLAFSIKGIVLLSLLLLLAWLLGDYPEWRSKRLKSLGNNETSKQETNNQDKLQPQQNGINNKKGGEKLSIIHYILVTPVAVLYIIARVVVDMIRFSLYIVLWSCERSIPYIDDWLFDTVTNWIPTKYNQLEKWWIEKGQPNFILYRNQFQQTTLPTMIQNMELFFRKSYEIGCVMHASMKKFIAAWKRFIERHDWHQRSQDLGDILYTVIWSPTVWIVTRSIKLCTIIYNGLRSAVISLKNDVVWTCTVAIPTVYKYMASTRLVKLVYLCSSKLSNGIQWTLITINNYILAPTLGRLLTWLVEGIDKLILLIQTNRFQQRLRGIHRWISPNIVWSLTEMTSVVLQIAKWIRLCFSQSLLPAYDLFMIHVKPQLVRAYQRIIQQHLVPLGCKIYHYLNMPLHYLYSKVIAPFINQLYSTLVWTLCMIQQLLAQLQVVLNKIFQVLTVYAQCVFSHVQVWLLEQLPILSRKIQQLYQLVLQLCDWNQLRQNMWTVAAMWYNWIVEQLNLVCLSLERSLGAWAKEQQEESGVTPLVKEKLL